MTRPTDLLATHVEPLDAALWLLVAFAAAGLVVGLVRGAEIVRRDGWRRL